MQQLDVLCVGDGIIDALLLLQHADEHSHEADEGREFCFRLGAKIPVDDCQFLLGGDASNVAVKTDRKSTRLNSSHQIISYAVFCLKKKKRILYIYYDGIYLMKSNECLGVYIETLIFA